MKNIFLALLFSLCLSAKVVAMPPDESGPGNGTDYVKVLFAQAHLQLLSEIASVDSNSLKNLELDAVVKDWLLTEVNGQSRWENMKRYLRFMNLQFQQQACSDFSGKPASICFFNQDPTAPYVLISLQENKMTTADQAMAMLFHEAGHFTGEMDHLFLDKVGVQLVKALQTPTLLISDDESIDTVFNPFLAKEECDAGTSEQALLLKKKLLMNLTLQCGQKQLSCDYTKTQFVFSGKANFREGVGYDMTVTCHGRAVQTLR